MFDGAEGDHDECEGGLGGVEPVGAVDDQSDPSVQAFVASVVDPETDSGEDASLAFADRLGDGDERLEAAAGSAFEQNRSIRMLTSSSERSPTKIARSASLSA